MRNFFPYNFILLDMITDKKFSPLIIKSGFMGSFVIVVVLLPLNKTVLLSKCIVIFLMMLMLFIFELTYCYHFGGNVFSRLHTLSIKFLLSSSQKSPYEMLFGRFPHMHTNVYSDVSILNATLKLKINLIPILTGRICLLP